MLTKFKKEKKSDTFQAIFFSTLIGILVLLMIGFLVFQNININRKRTKLTERIETLRKEIEELERHNEFLRSGISQIEKEEYIEKIAREELNLQKEGEKAVAFVMPEQNSEEKEETKAHKLKIYVLGWWEWLKSKF